VDKIDYNATYTNAITSTFTERVKIPIVVKDEEEAFELAAKTLGVQEKDTLRAIRIKNTLELDEMWVTPAVYREIQSKV